jgi:hypothetical protein
VQPQAGDGASAFMNDARQVGVLNVDLQQTCPLTLAGAHLWLRERAVQRRGLGPGQGRRPCTAGPAAWTASTCPP